MVVNIDSIRLGHSRANGGAKLPARATTQVVRQDAEADHLTIGLLNNMAGSAFKATERQFLSLLDSASAGIPIHVRFFTLPGMAANEAGGQQFASHYANIESIYDSRLDALIVTGREPKMAELRDEDYWESFTQVLEWARNNTYSAIWSCLAAHAAVLHLDGIGRRRSEEKNFGIFECTQGASHQLMQGLPKRYKVPHSRWNGVAQKDLITRGYSVLSRLDSDSADTFIKEEKSLFVFFQGHLEYETDTLMREYRRDVTRYIKGETGQYPPLPQRYFDSDTARALTVIRDQAAAFRTSELLANVAAAIDETQIANTWQGTAVGIYENWLEYVRARKADSEGRLRPIAVVSSLR